MSMQYLRNKKREVALVALALFIIPTVSFPAILGPTPGVRILVQLSMLIFLVLLLYIAVSSTLTFFKKFIVTAVISLSFSSFIYQGIDLIPGAFRVYVLQERFYVVTGTIVSLESRRKGLISNDVCLYRNCRLTVDSYPEELEYLWNPDKVTKGGMYRFLVLPGSRRIVGLVP